jgi:hypothetical protein
MGVVAPPEPAEAPDFFIFMHDVFERKKHAQGHEFIFDKLEAWLKSRHAGFELSQSIDRTKIVVRTGGGDHPLDAFLKNTWQANKVEFWIDNAGHRVSTPDELWAVTRDFEYIRIRSRR